MRQNGIEAKKYSSESKYCQKCNQSTHWTFECKNKAVYLKKDSRTKELNKPRKRAEKVNRIPDDSASITIPTEGNFRMDAFYVEDIVNVLNPRKKKMYDNREEYESEYSSKERGRRRRRRYHDHHDLYFDERRRKSISPSPERKSHNSIRRSRMKQKQKPAPPPPPERRKSSSSSSSSSSDEEIDYRKLRKKKKEEHVKKTPVRNVDDGYEAGGETTVKKTKNRDDYPLRRGVSFEPRKLDFQKGIENKDEYRREYDRFDRPHSRRRDYDRFDRREFPIPRRREEYEDSEASNYNKRMREFDDHNESSKRKKLE